MIEAEKPQKLLDKARERLRYKNMSCRTEQTYFQQKTYTKNDSSRHAQSDAKRTLTHFKTKVKQAALRLGATPAKTARE